MKPKLQLITMLSYNEGSVNTFISPSKNVIISVSDDKSITIFSDFDYKILQKIENAHDGIIFDISLKDENNFATCSGDRRIKTWTKSGNNKYVCNKLIDDAHDDDIHKIEYLKDNTIISGSKDTTIKIFNLINNNYACSLILNNSVRVYSLIYIEEKNILMSAGTQCTIFWNLSNVLNPFITLIRAFCHGKNAFQILDKERVVIGGREQIQIISIDEKKIIKEIDTEFLVWTICVIKNKNLFICGGVSPHFEIYNSDTYENLGIFKNCHSGNLRGNYLLTNGKIISGSEDKKTKIWEIFFE